MNLELQGKKFNFSVPPSSHLRSQGNSTIFQGRCEDLMRLCFSPIPISAQNVDSLPLSSMSVVGTIHQGRFCFCS